MKANIRTIVNTLVFLLIGVFFFWLAYHKTNFAEIKTILETGVNYCWIGVCLFLGLISHLFRALRWSALLEAVDKKPRFWNTFFAVFMGYFANLALPRMGELTRCGVLARYEKLNFTKTLGTVVTERGVDILSMLIFCALTVILQLRVFKQFFSTPFFSWNTHPVLIAIVLVAMLVLIVLISISFKIYSKHPWIIKIKSIFVSLWQGMKSIKNVKHKKTFIVYSILIWAMYYLMNYTCMFAFGFLNGITPSQAVFIFIAGTLSMLLPVQGGIGPWHTFTIQALMLYGIDRTEAGAYALLAHGAPMLMIIVGGFISMIILPLYNRKNIESNA